MTRLDFADSVSHALSHFVHTGNVALLNKAVLTQIYNEARDIIEEETQGVASTLNSQQSKTATP